MRRIFLLADSNELLRSGHFVQGNISFVQIINSQRYNFQVEGDARSLDL